VTSHIRVPACFSNARLRKTLKRGSINCEISRWTLSQSTVPGNYLLRPCKKPFKGSITRLLAVVCAPEINQMVHELDLDPCIY
jgi:hypothetical protein